MHSLIQCRHVCQATITVLYFASAKTAVSLSSESVELPRSPFMLSELPAFLLERHPAAAGELSGVLSRSALAVNEEIEDQPEKRILQSGDTVAVLPPVSGG